MILKVCVLALLTTAGPVVTKSFCVHEPFCPPTVRIEGAGPPFQYEVAEFGDFPSRIDTLWLKVPNVESRLLAVVAVSPGGSDVHFKTVILEVAEEDVRQVFGPLESTSQNAVCMGTFGGEPGLLVVEFLWENEPHYDRHRYRMTRFRWDGTQFQRAAVRTSKGKHSNWQSAARALGYNCKNDLIAALHAPD